MRVEKHGELGENHAWRAVEGLPEALVGADSESCRRLLCARRALSLLPHKRAGFAQSEVYSRESAWFMSPLPTSAQCFPQMRKIMHLKETG